MKASPYPGNFTGAGAATNTTSDEAEAGTEKETETETETPGDEVIWRSLTKMLEARLKELMSGWEAFGQLAAVGGDAWVGEVQREEAFVEKWTEGLTSSTTDVASTD